MSQEAVLKAAVITGLQLRGGEALRCELLVDASGRGSRLPEWLAAGGRPLEGLQCEVVDSGLGYATRTLAMPPNWLQEKAWTAPKPLHVVGWKLIKSFGD